MGVSAATWATIITATTALVGGGISYYSSTSAANSSAQFATLNAQAGLQQTQAQGRAQALQSQIQSAQATSAQNAANANATMIRDQTEAESRIAQENIRRSREAFRANMARQRAAGAGSGVVDTTGSPLDLLAAASEEQSLYENEQRWADENNRTKGFRMAAAEKLGGRVQGLNASLYQINASGALIDSRMKGSQISLDKFSALSSAGAAKTGAYAGLANSIGAAGASASDYYRYRNPPR